MDLVNGTADDRLRHREAYEKKLREKAGSRGPTNQTRSFVAHLARLDAVDWLACPTEEARPGRTRLGSGQPSGGREAEGRIRPADQVSLIAEAMTIGTWPRITSELGRVTSHPKEVRRELANHGWCDLLVGMIRVIDLVEGPLDGLSEMPASLIKKAVLTSSMQGERPSVCGAVVDLLVTEVWRAFKATACGGIPLVETLILQRHLGSALGVAWAWRRPPR